MQAGALQPYVRYIHTFSPEGDGKPVIAYDHRFFCVLSGKLGIGYGEESAELAAKDLILIPAGVPYRLHSTESEALAIGINFDLSDNGREYDPPIAPDSREKISPGAPDGKAGSLSANRAYHLPDCQKQTTCGGAAPGNSAGV